MIILIIIHLKNYTGDVLKHKLLGGDDKVDDGDKIY